MSASAQLTFENQRGLLAGDLWDFPARELHSTQGRWISPDPAGLVAVDITDPQTWNRYSFVRNTPTGLVDPDGLIGYCPWGALDSQTCAPPPSPGPFCVWTGLCEPGPTGLTTPTFGPTLTSTGGGGGNGSLRKPGQTIAQCMLQNQSAFSVAGFLNQGLNAVGVDVNLSESLPANVLLGNDVMGISSLLLGQDPNDSLASAIAVAGDKGLTGGVGTPTRIGGNTQPALQRLFPARGRPAQVLRRAAGLTKAAGYFSGVLEAKAAIDLALTAGLAVACR